MAELELRRGEEFQVGGDGEAYVVGYLVLDGEWLASGFHVPAEKWDALAEALARPAAAVAPETTTSDLPGAMADPPVLGLVRLVRVANADGLVYGAVLPAEHYSADLDGYGVKADPAAWALIEMLAGADQAADVVRRDADAYQRLLTHLGRAELRWAQMRVERERAYAGEDVVGIRLCINGQGTPVFEVPAQFAALLEELVRDLTRARNLVTALTADDGAGQAAA